MIIRSNLNIRPFVLVEHAGFRYLAVIQNGSQIGALAHTPDGRYVQVNGAVVQTLNKYKVLRALRREPTHKNGGRIPSLYFAVSVESVVSEALGTELPTTLPTTAPVVSIRRRRRVASEAQRE